MPQQKQPEMAEPATNLTTAQLTVTADDTTRQLATIWKEILRVESIGLDQNYFDLGGDSVLAVRLFAEIEDVFNVKLPLATLFEAPTIEELAGILRREAPTSGWSSLVRIQPNGTRPTFFCIHGAGGNVLIYRDLSRHLGSDQPFYGLQSQGLDGGLPPLASIEDMAGLYMREIRRVQRHGPYFLGGYCMGGTIAFELAQQLQARGEQVALLALFDTMNWSKVPLPSFWGKGYYEGQRFAFHTANFFRLDLEGKTRFFSEKLKALRNRVPVWRGMLLARLTDHSRAAKSRSGVLGQIWQANDRACLTYVPKPYPGAVTDFRPVRQYRMYNKPDVKWNQLAQDGQEIIIMPVYPAGMLVEPFVEHLAAALRKSIDQAIRRRETR